MYLKVLKRHISKGVGGHTVILICPFKLWSISVIFPQHHSSHDIFTYSLDHPKVLVEIANTTGCTEPREHFYKSHISWRGHAGVRRTPLVWKYRLSEWQHISKSLIEKNRVLFVKLYWSPMLLVILLRKRPSSSILLQQIMKSFPHTSHHPQINNC